MTYNKSQGQELQAVLVDLRKPPFTHGHLYVALSRVRRRDGIAAFVDAEDLEHSETPFTFNIVYPELLAPPTQTRALWRPRSEEHTSELQSLMRISYAVFCLKKKN